MPAGMLFCRAFLLLVLIPALVPQGTVQAGMVVGRVVMALDGSPLPGVEVLLTTTGSQDRSWRAITDQLGMYRIALPPGTYSATFTLKGFLAAIAEGITVAAGTAREQTAVLKPAPICEDCFPGLLFSGVIVNMRTTLGDIVIAVDTRRAPVTAANFLKYVDGGFYTNGRFHRATRADNYAVSLPNRPLLECIQAGINSDRRGEAFPPIALERTTVTKYHHAAGIVSMARGAGADTATSDFFILLNEQPSLDFGGMRFDDGQGAAAFGDISPDSMETVRKIQAQPTQGQSLTPPIAILSAKRVTPE
jgi:peptidyl-prolyl cis-trans isomerase A (cyclophilin A)